MAVESQGYTCRRIETQTFGEMHQTGCCYCCCKWYGDIEFTKTFKWNGNFLEQPRMETASGIEKECQVITHPTRHHLCGVCVCVCAREPPCLALPQLSPSPPTLIFPTANRVFLQGMGKGGVVQKTATEQRTLCLHLPLSAMWKETKLCLLLVCL